ncbi:hypothetical protein D1155_09135 [Anaerotruncus sp. 80]|uniref:Uncharacterized protein n=1 Tax=Anaerotruncus colihominis TaxID=169435 RepID=A0A845QM55_9FIRM|nr:MULTISPECIES: hypothetical protein [Anaerotruncus]NBH61813.1 hypothetical protein [Anaerotruncus colihominis]NCF02468.1 hypothetical protein [Anaerotruncus sp. 80]
MKRKRVTVLCLIFLLSLTSSVYAGSMTTKAWTITTDQAYANITLDDLGKGELANMTAEIDEDGRTYKAVKVTANVVGKSEPVTVKKTYTNLTDKKVQNSITKSGEKLKLDDVEWTEHRRNAATGTLTYKGSDKRPDAPKTKEITTSLPDGGEISVVGKLQDIKQTGSSYSKPFTVTAKFIGDPDVAYYKLENAKIPNNPETPTFEGYQETILRHLNYNPADYRITDGKWKGNYVTENGQTVRYAEFSGLRKVSDWTAYYEEELTADSPALATYDAVATYTNGMKDISYEVMVTVDYEEVGLSLLQKVLIVTAGIAILSIIIGLILMILKKKMEKNKNTVH